MGRSGVHPSGPVLRCQNLIRAVTRWFSGWARRLSIPLISPLRTRWRRIGGVAGDHGGWIVGRRVLVEPLVWPVVVEVAHVLVEDGLGVSFVVDQHPVGAFGADAADEPVRIAVRPRRPRRDLDHGNAFGAEDGIEGSGECGVPVADQEAQGADLVTEVHQQVAGSLGGPRRGRVRGHAEQVDPPGMDFHHEQNVEAAQRDGVEGEESVASSPVACVQEGSPPQLRDQDEDLDVLGRTGTREQLEPAEQPDRDQIQQPEQQSTRSRHDHKTAPKPQVTTSVTTFGTPQGVTIRCSRPAWDNNRASAPNTARSAQDRRGLHLAT